MPEFRAAGGHGSLALGRIGSAHMDSALSSMIDLVRRNPREAVRRAAVLPGLYFAAFRGRTRLVASLSEEMGVDEILDVYRSFRWGNESIKGGQILPEITRLLEILAADPPRVVLEIGTLNGGTLFLWCRVAAPDAVLVTVDVLGSALRRWSPHNVVFQSFARIRQEIVVLSRTDSHALATVESIRELLRRRPIDFLFIDGDHSYDGVKRDFELYSPLVRPGGIVAFHDVSPRPDPGTVGVLEFWNEFKQSHAVEEVIAPGPHLGSGIGLFRVPA